MFWESGKIIESWEDQSFDNWTGDTGSFSFITSNVYHRDVAIEITSGTGNSIDYAASNRLCPVRGDVWRFAFWPVNGDEFCRHEFFETDSNNRYFIELDVNENDLVVRKQSGGSAVTVGSGDFNTVYDHTGYNTIEVDTSQTGSNTITVTAYDSNDSQIGQAGGNDSDHDSGLMSVNHNGFSASSQSRWDYFRHVTNA